MAGERMRRVDSLLREAIAEHVAELKDPRVGFVTITGVRTSPDLRHATVYYTVLGDETQRRDTAAGLKAAAGRLRAQVGREVRMKYVPELRFELDEAVEHGLRMHRLLRELEEGAGSAEPEPGDGPVDDGPVADGPVADGPVDGAPVDGRPVDGGS